MNTRPADHPWTFAPRGGYIPRCFGGPVDRRGRPVHPRVVGRDGRIWVTRSILDCRVIHVRVDPLTVPLLDRPSVRRRIEAMRAAAWQAWSRTTCADWNGTCKDEATIVARARRLDTLAARFPTPWRNGF